ncbi:hypothetical protein PR048_033085 [Dryococelus australis]|uniref:Uncharacterized protein n=1 Tax=Dryococelus australis TaxID=614101 RepID=A0ABQ9FZA1_9NEOP|nr:hypothetical protein PR048_033085 [Dryococelus australis]
MPLVGGFSRGSPISHALSFRRCSILTSITLISSQDLAVKSRLLRSNSSLPASKLTCASSTAACRNADLMGSLSSSRMMMIQPHSTREWSLYYVLRMIRIPPETRFETNLAYVRTSQGTNKKKPGVILPEWSNIAPAVTEIVIIITPRTDDDTVKWRWSSDGEGKKREITYWQHPP